LQKATFLTLLGEGHLPTGEEKPENPKKTLFFEKK
jgi:hypothetical protein